MHEPKRANHHPHHPHPAEIAGLLRRRAKYHDRSLNGEIVRALREYTAKHEGEK
jgi:hypothetical protein